MRIVILMVFIFTGIPFSSGQIVPSSCVAPDSIVEKYKEDAYRLAMQKFFRKNLSYKDSVQIPYDHVDTVMRALLAVYNATGLPARDTVISQLDIHTFPLYDMNEMGIFADSGLGWMQQLRLGNIPTGDSTVDSLMATYDLILKWYYASNFPQHTVILKTDSCYNLIALGNQFELLAGVLEAGPVESGGGGNNITDSIYSDHVILIYTYGWGDCWSGCIYYRHWKFSVDTSCNVEYLGSYGHDLSLAAGINPENKNAISISPNPFYDQIKINGIKLPFNYSVRTLQGIEILSGKSEKETLENLNVLPAGLYFLNILSRDQCISIKIIKHE